MENRSPDVREIILERVFPELRYGGDPDIERYFELRAAGRMLDALGVYRARLRPRYPDDAKRVVLLKLYRTRSPAYPDFLRGLLLERADEIIARLRANVDALVAPLSGVSMRDTYAVLKAVERVARLLPDDAEAARRAAWDYAEYAKLLGHRKAETERAAYLLGEFYDQASVEDDVPADFVAASLASEESRRRRERDDEKKNFFDLSKIEFDEADVRRIEIPAGLERDEDIVLAYCHKYWLRVDDPAFERVVWLYSRKYGTKHYEVFKAIKTGRSRKYQDDDVLTMVGTAIATRYSYTVQGDLYMQAAWRRIKSSMYGQTATQKTARRAAREAEREAALGASPEATERSPSRADAARADAARAEPAAAPTTREPLPAADRDRRLVRVVAPAPPGQRASGSISDRIKRLSGRAYDVYRDIFLSRVRDHIHATLAVSRSKPGAVFRDETNKAENLIYDFMERNYSNAYMDWPASEHRSRVRELGFEVASLDGIIEACYKKISA